VWLSRHFDEARLLIERDQWFSFRSSQDDRLVVNFSMI
jgi:hypothetical protein